MKKSIALFAAAALSLGLAACSSTEAETETGALIIDGRTVSGAGGAFVKDGEVQFGDGTGDGAFDRTETIEGAGGAWSEGSSSDLPLGGDTRSTRGSGGALEGMQLDRDGYLLSLDCRKTLAYLEDANRAGGSQVSNLDRATAYNGARTAFNEVASSTDNEELASVLVEFDGLDNAEFAAALDATGAAVIEACNA